MKTPKKLYELSMANLDNVYGPLARKAGYSSVLSAINQCVGWNATEKELKAFLKQQTGK